MEHADEIKWTRAVADTLRAERAIAHMTQKKVSDVTGIARTSYRMYEEGTRNPDAVQLAKIAEAFGVKFSHLIEEMQRRVSEG